jgi:hypothetical protein
MHPAAVPPRTVNGEGTADAAAGAADVATDVAMRGIEDLIEDRSRVLRGLPSIAQPHLFLSPPVRKNPAERTSQAPQRDISRYCFRENRFLSTGV